MANKLLDSVQVDKVYLICGRTDLRKGIDGLSILVADQFQLDPFQSALFLFCGTRADRFKALIWEGDGFLLLYKRIENGRLQWPRNKAEVRQLDADQLRRLLTGFSIDPSIKQTAPAKFY
ncbi:MAG: IS66 family insertion sequence element accessory protein TnpB [Lactobacillaceae bacterium]|jgi:transposase|nr:IS66 family insertion sequence element accessory protein TnpB [Lactobacillaceae bacterium]